VGAEPGRLADRDPRLQNPANQLRRQANHVNCFPAHWLIPHFFSARNYRNASEAENKNPASTKNRIQKSAKRGYLPSEKAGAFH
jgi:hypothetical protein